MTEKQFRVHSNTMCCLTFLLMIRTVTSSSMSSIHNFGLDSRGHYLFVDLYHKVTKKVLLPLNIDFVLANSGDPE